MTRLTAFPPYTTVSPSVTEQTSATFRDTSSSEFCCSLTAFGQESTGHKGSFYHNALYRRCCQMECVSDSNTFNVCSGHSSGGSKPGLMAIAKSLPRVSMTGGHSRRSRKRTFKQSIHSFNKHALSASCLFGRARFRYMKQSQIRKGGILGVSYGEDPFPSSLSFVFTEN